LARQPFPTGQSDTPRPLGRHLLSPIPLDPAQWTASAGLPRRVDRRRASGVGRNLGSASARIRGHRRATGPQARRPTSTLRVRSDRSAEAPAPAARAAGAVYAPVLRTAAPRRAAVPVQGRQMDIADALAVVREQHHAVLATSRGDGTPQMSPVAVARLSANMDLELSRQSD
jgi:hypothetical protein